jgi:hypothetical protein
MGSSIGTLAISFHGGATLPGVNNLYAFPPTGGGRLLLGASRSPSPGMMPELSELRAFLPSLDGSFLYVANGSKNQNQVLRFARGSAGDAPWVFHDVYAADGLEHPFDLVFGWDGTLFVSNQDSNEVTTYDTAGEPGPLSITGLTKVRGLAFDGTYLYVADAGDDAVKVYDATGTCRRSIAVKRPVHLLYDGARWLWIGSERKNGKDGKDGKDGKEDEREKDAVHVYDTNAVQPGEAVKIVHGAETGIDHTAGLCLLPSASGHAGTLLVASRLGRQILSFPIEYADDVPTWTPAKPTVVLDKDVLIDNPEFVALAGGE